MKNGSCVKPDIKLSTTGFGYILSLIGGKYKMTVIYKLYENAPFMRYNELKKSIRIISFKTLTSTLKELENDDLIIRKEYPQIPPRVEYSLSEKGKTLIPILNMMCDWGERNMKI
ncbi:winged helix-turn-helix transcriptional regulator [Pseudoleptotrichia goodfellowii]|uniref:Transcriptional regulator n=1 Tax=Pseudoleptotrichia goodfellowii TaxID=157692 RepID=A0A510JAC9_9FUSO|nr:helix-turn-helix domain-containing protein [Pseudoleptotrichia goodfellowii]BBM36279.1 transcriptional regulator [Pseudoleptotrichia goodfellowii]